MAVLVRTLLLDVVFSVGIAYLIKFLWMRAEWVQHQPPPPPVGPTPPPPPDGTNSTMTAVPTPSPAVFPWADVVRTSNFAAWDALYLRALAISVALVLVSTLLLWYLGASAVHGLRAVGRAIARGARGCCAACRRKSATQASGASAYSKMPASPAAAAVDTGGGGRKTRVQDVFDASEVDAATRIALARLERQNEV